MNAPRTAEGSDSASQRTRAVSAAPSVGWHQSLWARLLGLSLVAWLLFSAGAALLQDQVGTDVQERQALQRTAVQFDLLTRSAQTLATQLAQIAASPDGLAQLRSNAPALIQQQPITGMLASVGVWPLPNTLDPTRERASLVWVHQADGSLTLREDYNDSRIAAYTHEKWFTPARYSPGSRCHWTAAYTDPLSRKSVVTCSAPIRTAQGFLGAVSVSLDVDAIASQLEAAAAFPRSSAMVTTLAGDVAVATGTLRQQPPRNLADLGRQDADFNPLALAIHRAFESTVQAVAPDANMIAALVHDSREMSQDEAVSALVGLALTTPTGPLQPRVQSTAISGALWGHATVTQWSVPGQWWTLLQIVPAAINLPGLGWVSKEIAIASLTMLGFIALLLWALKLWALGPIDEMTAQIAAATNTRDTHHPINENYSAELARLAHWHNESQRQLLQLQRQAPRNTAPTPVQELSGESRAATDHLQRTRERTLSALRAIRDGVVIFNEQGRIEEINLVAEKILGQSAQTAVGKTFGDVLKIRPTGEVKTTLPDLADLVLRLKAPMDLPQAVLLTDANGDIHTVRAGFHPVLTRQGNPAGCIAIITRADAAKAARPDTLRRTPDNLTGLPMRGSCESDLQILISEPPAPLQKHALLFVDADDLKRVNDAQGQRAGDDVVIQIAGILNTLAKKHHHSAYRLYGDQFAILMKDTDEPGVAAFAEAVCARFSGAALRGQSDGFRMTVSIGTCLIDGTSTDSSEIIRRGEIACAAAKRLGGNCAQPWSPSAQESKRQADESLWLKRIRAGLERDMFHLTTQRLAPSQNGNLTGYQVLLALEDEEGFWSPASAFLPTAQRHDLTGELDRWLIRHSVQHLRDHPAVLDKAGFVCLHLSDSALADNELLESLVSLFSGNLALPASKFCFVFTEHALHQHPHSGAVCCEVLRNLGCKIGIDGFVGRRTSDIAHFRKLSVDFIRIDTSNFPHVDTDSIEQMLTESLISVARALCKHIIASNLETATKLQAWQKLGADYVQGEAVAKASPVLFM